MSSILKIGPLNLNEVAESADQYDLGIVMVGYESRGVAVVGELGQKISQIIAYEYQHNQVLSFQENLAYLQHVGALVVPLSERENSDDLRSRVDTARSLQKSEDRAGPLRIAVDISSMDRDQIGRTLSTLDGHEASIIADFFYSLGVYTEGLIGSEGLVVVNRAVEGFEGWTTDPTLPLVCLVGCGFESQLALAAVETLEPSHSIWLLPRGEDERYYDTVMERNRLLIEDSGTQPNEYDVLDPYNTLVKLEATTASLLTQSRVVLVPIGPKIFALECMLTALAHEDNVSVWRLSADDQRTAEDREASGTIIGLRVEFRMQGAEG